MIYAIIKDQNGIVVGGGAGDDVTCAPGFSKVPVDSREELNVSLATMPQSKESALDGKIAETIKLMAVERLQADDALTVEEVSLAEEISTKAIASISINKAPIQEAK